MTENPSYNEKDLFTHIANGDEHAFAEVFHAYGKRLYPFVLQMLHSEIWAEEVVQDVFERLWINRRHLLAIDNPTAYLFRMATNRTLDYIKQHQRQISIQYQLALGEATDNYTADQLNVKFTEQLLFEAVDQLPPQRKKVYQLVREEGKSYGQIAVALGISRNTVRNHMAEALEAIRSYLVDKGGLWALHVFFWIGQAV